jgi:hypothetical protein
MFRYLVPAVTTFLVACQPAFVNGTPNENSTRFTVPVGSAFVLSSEILVPPRTDRLYFQDGDLPAWYDVNKNRPYCILQVNSAIDRVRIIEPDEFVVTSITAAHSFQLFEAQPRGPEQVAAATGAGRRIDDREADRGDTREIFGSAMRLHSARQPDVTQLTCADWGLPQSGTHITVQKIRRALGGYFRLRVASK